MTAQRLLYTARGLPLFQNRMFERAADALATPVGDVELVEDLESGLVYNRRFEAARMDYDDHYQNEQAVSDVFRQHLDSVADIVLRRLGERALVEVGCGKGYFLELLAARGADVHGFDPTYEGVNPRVSKRYFEAGVGVRADGIVLRHVLEHVADPVGFLEALRDANGGRGNIYIEVPCFEWICERRAWFDVFYEHVNYFRPSDFHRMFGAVHESGHVFGGQYQYVVADLASIRRPRYDAADPVRFPDDFAAGLEQHPDAGGLVWGGASKGVIFALLRERAGWPVDGVVDINPAKQGKYLPATGLKVMTPAEAIAVTPAGSPVYVMNSNYLEEIKTMSRNLYTYRCVDRRPEIK